MYSLFISAYFKKQKREQLKFGSKNFWRFQLWFPIFGKTFVLQKSHGHSTLMEKFCLKSLNNSIYWLEVIPFAAWLGREFSLLLIMQCFSTKYYYREYYWKNTKSWRRKVATFCAQDRVKNGKQYDKRPHLKIKRSLEKSYTFIIPSNKKQTGCDQETEDCIANRWMWLTHNPFQKI